jgi:hypothetical protein
VLYRSGAVLFPAGTLAAYAAQVPAGDRIDRILAGPNSRVRWEDGRLYVDDVESPLRPLNPAAAPGRLAVQVPPGHFLIIPTTLPRVNPQAPADLWTHMCLVPAREIRGTVYLRTHPLSRFGRIR